METGLIQLTSYLFTQSWQIALLVVVIAAVGLALKNKSAHVRYLLWLIVLAKYLMPPLLNVTLAILPQEKSTEPILISPPAELLSIYPEMVDSHPYSWRKAGDITRSSSCCISTGLKSSRAERIVKIENSTSPH